MATVFSNLTIDLTNYPPIPTLLKGRFYKALHPLWTPDVSITIGLYISVCVAEGAWRPVQLQQLLNLFEEHQFEIQSSLIIEGFWRLKEDEAILEFKSQEGLTGFLPRATTLKSALERPGYLIPYMKGPKGLR